MRRPFRISPREYFVISAVALVALTLIVFTGAAVRVTGSGLGCPNWPQCYHNGRFVAELNSHAWIEFGNRMFTGLVALSAGAAGLLAYFRRPFRRDLAVLGTLLPLGVIGQAVMGGLTVLYGLAPGWVMGHYLLSMAILVAAGALAWRARPAFGAGEAPAADRTTARAVWALWALGALTIVVGTAATAAGPHAGGEGTGDVVHRFDFKGAVDRQLAHQPPRHARRRPRAAGGRDVVAGALARRRRRAAVAPDAHLPPRGGAGRGRDRAVPARPAGRSRVAARGARDAAVGRARARRDAGRLAAARAPERSCARARAGARGRRLLTYTPRPCPSRNARGRGRPPSPR